MSMVFKVKGKSDKKPAHLILWRNDEFPELCPVRHLLVYVKISGFDSGFLFPKQNFKVEDVEQRKYDYPSFLENLRRLCTGFLHRPAGIHTYGTHVLRKTAYVFAIFGVLNRYDAKNRGTKFGNLPDVDMGSVQLGARHQTISTSAIYTKDTITLYYHLQEAGTLEANDVGVFRDIRMENKVLFAVGMGTEYYKLQLPLTGLAEWYVTKYLKMSLNPNELLQSQKCILELALSTHSTKVTNKNSMDLEKVLRLFLGRSNVGDAVEMLGRLKISEREKGDECGLTIRENTGEVEKSLDNFPDSTEGVSGLKRAPETLILDMIKPKKAKTYGENDIEARLAVNWQAMTTEERLDSLLEAALCDRAGLNNAARGFVSKWAKPVSVCLKECHDNNRFAFLATNASIRPTCASTAKFVCFDCMNRKKSTVATVPNVTAAAD